MSGRIQIAADAGPKPPRSLTRKARILGFEMLLLAALGVALGLARELPISVFNAAELAALATLGCVLIGWPELLIGRMRGRGLLQRQSHIREAEMQAIREHFDDDLTMPPSGEASAHGTDQSG